MLSPNNDIHTIQRELEIITEALESLEDVSSQNEIPSNQIGQMMVPLCLNLGNIIDKLQAYQSAKGEILVTDFAQKRRNQPRIDSTITDRDKTRAMLSEGD